MLVQNYQTGAFGAGSQEDDGVDDDVEDGLYDEIGLKPFVN